MVMTPGGKQKKRALSHSPDGGLSGKKKKLSQGGGAVQTPPAKPKQTDVNMFKQINSKKSPVAQMTPGKKQLEKKQKSKPNKAALISQKEDSDSDDDDEDDEEDEDDDTSDENNVSNKSLQTKNKNANASVIKTDNADDDDDDDDDDDEEDDDEDDEEEDDDEDDEEDDDEDDDDDDEEDDENQVTLNKQQPKGNQINSQKKETGNVNKPLLGEHANEEESSDDDDDDDEDEEEDDDTSENDDTPGLKVSPKKPKLDAAQQEASPSREKRYAMFVTNISSRCDKQKLKELFEKVVPVKDINILPNRGDKWAAVVVLNNEEDQKKSLSLHQNMVEGKRICIVYSDQTRNNEGGGGGGFRGRGGRGFGGGRGGSPGRGGFRGGRGGQGDFRGGRGGQRDFRGGGGRGGQGGFRGGRGGQGGFSKGEKSPGEKRTFGDMRNSGQSVNTKKTFGED